MFRSLMVVSLILSVVLAACTPAAPVTPVAPQPYPAPTQVAPVSGGAAYPVPPANLVVESPVNPYPDDSDGGTVDMPYLPQSGDEKMTCGEAFLDETTLMSLESYPPQISLHLAGNLPNPCHQLRVNVQRPDAKNQIQIEVYSVVGTDVACIEVLQPFDVSVPLGSFPAGKYTVFVNGEQIGEFEN